jgi:glycosyltransferase involved in cell wall biosynthesis
MNDAAFTVTVTKYNRDYLRKINPGRNNRVYIVPTALDLAEFPVTKGGGDADRLHILSVGRLVEKKGFEYLIEALAILGKKGTKFNCNIIGEGPLRERLQALIERCGLSGGVTLAGAKSMPDVIRHYERSDVFVLPCVISRDGDRDGLPHSIIESMACALPTVCTDIIGIGELIKSGANGLLVNPMDPAALADVLELLSRDPALRKSLGEAARRTIQEDYEIGRTAARLRSYMGI